ncbi:MAG TPA: hypothetical protein DIW07_10825 [Lachnospiraceae bacterium]|uniref:Uncharacterized protein n=1 Tax=Muricomes intestini TaxID=1796634 RepID=A0A4R3K749_9FIRM|nr:hypothetical protein [Muricomes intestini]TCS78511.1 hypothetical protein EDD59_11136 [Muricomes intestini]HCR83885.1 hypothetical protein [Lachnospiraceae bacterium]
MNDQCASRLRKELMNKGDMPIDDIRGEARKMGFTKTELKETRKILGVRLHTTYQGYFWCLEV